MTADRYSVAGLARFADTIRTLTDRPTWETNLGTPIRTVLRHAHLPQQQDVRGLDVDEILATFAANARDDLSPTSASTYDTIFRKAVRRFVAYTDGQRSWDRDEGPAQSSGAHLLAHALQLRPDVTVRMRLPADLTSREARRLTRFIDALVDDPLTTDQR